MRSHWAHVFFALFVVASPLHAASAPQPLRVAYTSVTGNRAPFWIAKEAKLFEKHGLQVELIYLQSVAQNSSCLERSGRPPIFYSPVPRFRPCRN
jgi:ABC-type nitrate/sulfonate/bicarbonate transport system substrate-binding protein